MFELLSFKWNWIFRIHCNLETFFFFLLFSRPLCLVCVCSENRCYDHFCNILRVCFLQCTCCSKTPWTHWNHLCVVLSFNINLYSIFQDLLYAAILYPSMLSYFRHALSIFYHTHFLCQHTPVILYRRVYCIYSVLFNHTLTMCYHTLFYHTYSMLFYHTLCYSTILYAILPYSILFYFTLSYLTILWLISTLPYCILCCHYTIT